MYYTPPKNRNSEKNWENTYMYVYGKKQKFVSITWECFINKKSESVSMDKI